MAELTPEAKAEIAEAIRIVREDRFEQYVRNRTAGAPAPANDPPKVDPPVVDPPVDPNLPPKKDEPPKEPKKAGLWWPASEDDQ